MKPVDCLDVYRNGKYYDLENARMVEDIPFYLQQARKHGGPVLELACGTGRITIPLAEAGIDVTGLDISEPMLSHARVKAKRKKLKIRWVRADCRDFRLPRTFNLIIFPFNSIAHLKDLESIESCLSSVRRHLAEEGRFIIDHFNPRLDILTRDSSRRYPVAEYLDPDGGEDVVVTESNVYNRATQVNEIKWYYKIGTRPEEVVDLNMRIYYPQELDAFLHYNGFRVEDKFGDYEGHPFDSSSPKQIVVSRLSGQRPKCPNKA